MCMCVRERELVGDGIVVHFVELVVFAVHELWLSCLQLKVVDLFRIVANTNNTCVKVGWDHSWFFQSANWPNLWLHFHAEWIIVAGEQLKKFPTFNTSGLVNFVWDSASDTKSGIKVLWVTRDLWACDN